MQELFLEDNTGAVLTILVALLSLLGNVMQYFRSPKKPRTEEDVDLAQSINNITEAYDNLFNNMREHILSLETEIEERNKIIDELTQVKDVLRNKVEHQQRQLDKQERQITQLKKKVRELENGDCNKK